MSIIIFGDLFSFPEGLAATNRVHTYAKGFIENHISVHVICFRNTYNSDGDGVINGICYYHPFGQRERNKYFIVRSWQKIVKYFTLISLVNKIHKKDKISAITVYSNLLNTHLTAWFLAKITRSKLLQECGEHPLRFYQEGAVRKKLGFIKFKLEADLSDGIICISQFLIDFHRENNIPENKLLHIPSTVDPERFETDDKPPLNFDYILYCGSLSISKDGVNILIESFASIYNKHPEIYLVLIGKGDLMEEENYLKELVEKLRLSEKIIFLGQMPRNEIPRYMNNSKILALARPISLVADAGFPSKLTEYLATGIPVVVTDVGEISVYLKDNENAFLSAPGSVDAFAEKLDYVLSNYQLATSISAKGKLLTKNVFNYYFQAARIIDFVGRNKLINNQKPD
jgi:glycosyltransferase involved in cell wall biosynthesis